MRLIAWTTLGILAGSAVGLPVAQLAAAGAMLSLVGCGLAHVLGGEHASGRFAFAFVGFTLLAIGAPMLRGGLLAVSSESSIRRGACVALGVVLVGLLAYAYAKASAVTLPPVKRPRLPRAERAGITEPVAPEPARTNRTVRRATDDDLGIFTRGSRR